MTTPLRRCIRPLARVWKKAIGAGELSPRDQALVTDMWENLFQQASQQ
ncbi:protein [Escherichia coli]|nr:protein [Escherichia coli]